MARNDVARTTLAPVEPADNDSPEHPGDLPGADVSARLLLALTSLYAQRSNHTAEEQRQYTKLALGLIDKAGPGARTTVAARLQHHPDAPAAVIERLSEGDYPGEASAGDTARLEAIPASEIVVAPATAGRESLAAEPAGPEQVTAEFGEAFFAVGPDERRRMLSTISRGDLAPASHEHAKRFHLRMDAAPWRSRTGAFIRDFAQLIDAPTNLCTRILDDPWGDPMVVAARATGMPVAILQRILLLVSPAAHHSVHRVYELTELYHGLDAETARNLLAVWREAAIDDAAPDRPLAGPAAITNLRARFRALNARIEGNALTSRSGPESAGRPDLPSR